MAKIHQNLVTLVESLFLHTQQVFLLDPQYLAQWIHLCPTVLLAPGSNPNGFFNLYSWKWYFIYSWNVKITVKKQKRAKDLPNSWIGNYQHHFQILFLYFHLFNQSSYNSYIPAYVNRCLKGLKIAKDIVSCRIRT